MDKETTQGKGRHVNSKFFQLLCILNSIYFTFVFERHFCWIRNYRLTGFFSCVFLKFALFLMRGLLSYLYHHSPAHDTLLLAG